MVIDARDLEPEELFKKLRDILASMRGKDVFIEVLLGTRAMNGRIRAFVSMSGCSSEIEEKNGYYVMRVTGSPCCA